MNTNASPSNGPASPAHASCDQQLLAQITSRLEEVDWLLGVARKGPPTGPGDTRRYLLNHCIVKTAELRRCVTTVLRDPEQLSSETHAPPDALDF